MARGCVTKAIEIDESLAEAYAALANIELHNRNWAAAERNLKYALKLNPNYADAHYRYSVYLTAMGRFDEAVAAAKLAQVTDPLWLIIGTQLGAIYQLMGEYEQAVECCDEVIEMDPSFARAYGIKGITTLTSAQVCQRHHSQTDRHEVAYKSVNPGLELVFTSRLQPSSASGLG